MEHMLPREKVKLDATASTIFAPQLVGLVTTLNARGKPNVATFAWATSTSHEPELIGISASHLRYSHRYLKSEFVLNLPTEDLLKDVWLVGTVSGRNVNKFAVSGLTPLQSLVVKPPRIQECPTHIECKTLYTFETGDHTIFVGKVVAKSGDKDAVVDGALNQRISPVFHLGGTKFMVGDRRIDVRDL